MRAQGTTTVEIKSGYGLTVADEARALRLAAEVTPETTFLGAHVVPPGADRRAYVDLVAGPMLDACAPHARWVDVFCEPHSPHAFDGDEARATVLKAGRAAGLGLRVHANQLGRRARAWRWPSSSARPASTTAPTSPTRTSTRWRAATPSRPCCPGVEFSTRSPYPDARRLLDAGVTVALATDCNPGTCYSSSMPLMIALAVREMGMTPDEALWSATAGGAQALRRDDIGVIRPGARADLTVLDGPEPPAPGVPAGGADRADSGVLISRTSSMARPRVATWSSSVSPAG